MCVCACVCMHMSLLPMLAVCCGRVDSGSPRWSAYARPLPGDRARSLLRSGLTEVRPGGLPFCGGFREALGQADHFAFAFAEPATLAAGEVVLLLVVGVRLVFLAREVG